MPVTDHPAVSAYLSRLRSAGSHLTKAQRRDLRAKVVARLTDAVPDPADNHAIQAAVERLGSPEAMVQAEYGDPAIAARSKASGRRSVDHEQRAANMLTLGSALPVVGWLIGVVLLWRSKIWTTWEKVVGTLLVPLGPFGAVYLLVLALLNPVTCTAQVSVNMIDQSDRTEISSNCPTDTGWGSTVAFVGLLLAMVVPWIVTHLLMQRARKRAGVPFRKRMNDHLFRGHSTSSHFH